MSINNKDEDEVVFLNWSKSGEAGRMFLDNIKEDLEDIDGLVAHKDQLEKFVAGEQDYAIFNTFSMDEGNNGSD